MEKMGFTCTYPSFNRTRICNTPENWERFISNLERLPSEIKVIGINDYIFIDGYKRVLNEKQKGRLSNIELILPVIELRIDKFANVSEDDPFLKL